MPVRVCAAADVSSFDHLKSAQMYAVFLYQYIYANTLTIFSCKEGLLLLMEHFQFKFVN